MVYKIQFSKFGTDGWVSILEKVFLLQTKYCSR